MTSSNLAPCPPDPGPEPQPDSGAPRYWLVPPGLEGWHWDECWEGGFIALPDAGLGDLRGLAARDFEGKFRGRPARPHGLRRRLRGLWDFYRGVRPGDGVLAPRVDRGLVGIGRIRGPYQYLPDATDPELAHRFPVEWTGIRVEPALPALARSGLPVELTREGFEARARGGAGGPAPEPPSWVAEPLPTYGRYPGSPLPPDGGAEGLAAELGLAPGLLAEWLGALERKGQAILQGPPGTGKTWAAERIARHLTAGGRGCWELVQFHAGYAYEDFIQGLRPAAGPDGRLEYRMAEGAFPRFCRRARAFTGPCVLVLDEINRTDLARTFGELLYLLEYRGRPLRLAGGGELAVPANVRILGTMNAADRGVAPLDQALRRRFAFFTLAPDYGLLRRFHARGPAAAWIGPLADALARANARIDDPDGRMGVAPFLRPGLDLEAAGAIWRSEIEPWLSETFHDQPGLAAEFAWDRVAADWDWPARFP